MTQLADHVVFHNAALSDQFANKLMPIDTLFEAYFDGELDIPGDISLLLRDRHQVTKHKFTPAHVKYFLTKFVPEFSVHSKSWDRKLVQGHYDRGDDFFGAFLGPRMVYTSGFFTEVGQTVEQAQDQKMDLVCQKLMLKPGETFLDIGCGWGTLVRYAVEHYVQRFFVSITVTFQAPGSKRSPTSKWSSTSASNISARFTAACTSCSKIKVSSTCNGPACAAARA
jgi:hypothetical protein